MDLDSSGFLAEVIADPDNDIPRLIYADWLEEQGSPRGEFIRVQCELSQTNDLDPRWLDLQARSEQLLTQHGKQWAEELGQDVRKCEYTRGFIETITILARTLLKNGDQLFESFPVGWIRLNYMKGTAEHWQDCAALQHVRYLDLSGLKIPDVDLVAILSSPHLNNLKGIKLGGLEMQISEEIMFALSRPRIAGTLEFLEFHGPEETTNLLMNAFQNSIGLPKLQHLFLSSEVSVDLGRMTTGSLKTLEMNANLSLRGAEQLTRLAISELRSLQLLYAHETAFGQLAKAGVFESPETVRFGGIELSPRCADWVFQGRNLQNCRSLDLRGFRSVCSTELGSELMQMISAHAPLQALRELKVSNLQPGHLALLLRSPFLQNLESIRIEESSISAEDFAELVASGVHKSLKKLWLDRMCPPSEALSELKNTIFPNLLHLAIDRRFMYGPSMEGVEAEIISLLQSGSLPALQNLTISGISLTEKTLLAIAECPNLGQLRQFHFDENHGSNEAMFAVLESSLLPRLRLFSLKGCRGLRRSAKLAEKYGTRLRY